MSNHDDMNYVGGYSNGTHDRGIWGKDVHLGSLPANTNDDYRVFYSGFYNGVLNADTDYGDSGNATAARWDSHHNLLCPSGHQHAS